ncbi:MAG: hypothetical protein K2M17_05025 [Bacilli bacterium]|nr:hypothetical protein [Bacilli bacterium]
MNITNETYIETLERFKNQIFRALPEREENKDYKKTLNNTILEIRGFSLLLDQEKDYVILLSKLIGLIDETDDVIFRKNIFDGIQIIEQKK